ncbi:MAG: hypothetical protein RR425_05595 [Erysipelotrichales bacterium]
MGNLGNILAEHHAIVLFFILMVYMGIGDFLSSKTKALVPSILVYALLLLFTSWAGLIPPNIVDLAGVSSTLLSVLMLIMVLNMGTSLNIKDIVGNWRVAVVGIAALAGVAIFVLFIGSQFFDWKMAVISAPAVGGGIVAAMEMKNAAEATGSGELATMAVLILTLHSFPAFVSVPTILKRIMKRELSLVDIKEWKANKKEKKGEVSEKCIVPEKYQTPSIILMQLAFVGVLSYLSFLLTGLFMGQYAISTTIFALIYSVFFTEIGFLPRNALNKAGANGLVLTLVIVGAMASLAASDQNQVISMIVPIVSLILIGVLGIFVMSVIIGKLFFKFPWDLSFVIGLNSLLGFPINYMITSETIKAASDDEDEQEYLNEKIMPIMLVAGFTTITIGSVFLAGILKNFL